MQSHLWISFICFNWDVTFVTLLSPGQACRGHNCMGVPRSIGLRGGRADAPPPGEGGHQGPGAVLQSGRAQACPGHCQYAMFL